MAKHRIINPETGQWEEVSVEPGEPPIRRIKQEQPVFEILADVKWRAGDILLSEPNLTLEQAERRALQEYLDKIRVEAEVMVERYRETTAELIAKLESRLTELRSETGQSGNPIAGEIAGLRGLDAEAQSQTRTVESAVQQVVSGLTTGVIPEAVGVSASAVEVSRRGERYVEGVPVEYRKARELADWASLRRRRPTLDMREDILDELIVESKRQAPIMWQAIVITPDGRRFNKSEFYQTAIGKVQHLRDEISIAPDQARRMALSYELVAAEEHIDRLLHEVTTELQKRSVMEFFNQPLASIHDELRQGERHPRMFLTAESFGSPEELIKSNLKEKVKPAYADLVAGLPSLPDAFPEAESIKAEARRAAYQIENGFFKEAAETVHRLASAAVSDRALHERLASYRDAIREQAKDYSTEIPAWNESLYRNLDNLIPKWKTRVERALADPDISDRRREELREELAELQKREMRLRDRRAVETTLLKGTIVKWESAGKGIEKRLTPRGSLLAEEGEEGEILGKEKVYIVTLEKLDMDGKPIFDARGEPETMQAFVKTPHNEKWFRQNIPPTSVAVNEWLAGFEAVAFGADEAFPATTVRETAFGLASFQEYVQDKDENGARVVGMALNDLRDASGNPRQDWPKHVLQRDKEMVAILHALQRAADAGVPNHLITRFSSDTYRVKSVDNSLINPSTVSPDQYISFLAAERAAHRQDEPLSPLVLSHVRNYAELVEIVISAIEDLLPYDTRAVNQNRRALIAHIQRTRNLPAYNGVTNNKFMRDGGICEREYSPAIAAQTH